MDPHDYGTAIDIDHHYDRRDDMTIIDSSPAEALGCRASRPASTGSPA